MTQATARARRAPIPILNVETVVVPIDSIAPAPDNPNQGDVGLIGQSIKEHGFYGVVVVQRSRNRIICGAHRWLAAKQLGLTEIPVTFVDVSDRRARRIMLVDNRATRQGHDDLAALLEMLAEMAAEPEGLMGTGFSEDDLQGLLQDINRPLDAGDPSPDAEHSRLTVSITFPSEQARADWSDFAQALRAHYPDLDGLGMCLHAFVTSAPVQDIVSVRPSDGKGG